MLAPLEVGIEYVRIRGPLTDDEHQAVAELLRGYPEVGLATAWNCDATDLEYLKFFPEVPSLSLGSNELRSLDGLRHLNPETLHELGISETKTKLDLAVLGRFVELRSLGLDHHTRGIDVLSRLTGLVDLLLRSVTLPDLSILLPLDHLRLLDICLGGTKDLSLLGEVGSIEYLELWMIRGLADISGIARLSQLQYLHLQSMRNVEALPSMGDLLALRGVRLETMKGLHDLSPLRNAPALEELDLVDMGHLTPADLQPLVGHPTLRGATIGLGSDKKNKAAREQTGLPDLPYRNTPWRTMVSLQR